MKVCVDRAKCTGLGICESLAPDFFEVDDLGELVFKADVVDNGQLDDVRQAVDSCPTEALSLEG